jgi:hypothetical protein
LIFPNLVIAGAPKCGTSSLFNWLADHPDVCGSTEKEPFFLMDRDNPLRRRECNFHDHGLDAYAGLFAHCGDRQIAMEATTHYIYQATAIEVLASLPSEPRVLFLLRQPSERVFSSFSYSKAMGNVRSDLSFAQFVGLVSGRRPVGGKDWAWGRSAYVLRHDIAYSRYVDHLVKWRQRLGAERMCILLFESMRMDSHATVQRLCGCLGLDPAFYDSYDFSPRNRTLAVRSSRAQRFARSIAAKMPAGAIKDQVKRVFNVVQLTAKGKPRSAADTAALAELDAGFRPFNERLANEFGLELEAWKSHSF